MPTRTRIALKAFWKINKKFIFGSLLDFQLLFFSKLKTTMVDTYSEFKAALQDPTNTSTLVELAAGLVGFSVLSLVYRIINKPSAHTIAGLFIRIAGVLVCLFTPYVLLEVRYVSSTCYPLQIVALVALWSYGLVLRFIFGRTNPYLHKAHIFFALPLYTHVILDGFQYQSAATTVIIAMLISGGVVTDDFLRLDFGSAEQSRRVLRFLSRCVEVILLTMELVVVFWDLHFGRPFCFQASVARYSFLMHAKKLIPTKLQPLPPSPPCSEGSKPATAPPDLNQHEKQE